MNGLHVVEQGMPSSHGGNGTESDANQAEIVTVLEQVTRLTGVVVGRLGGGDVVRAYVAFCGLAGLMEVLGTCLKHAVAGACVRDMTTPTPGHDGSGGAYL